MSKVAIEVKNVSKEYRLGVFGTGMLSTDIKRWWYRIRGKEDPFRLVTAENDRTTVSESEFVWALKDINFSVKQGEVLGIIGRNGAGKSTLLKVLSQVTPPSTGSIKARGRIASLLEVGTGMHPELTGRENIFLNGSILGMSKAEISSKLEEIVEFSGCAKYIDTPLKRYSSGMKVRLGFAVAAFLEPEILIVDEVLAVGDAEFQKKAIGKMKDVSKGEGRTVLFVSHNMGSIRALCDRGLVMEQGKLAFDGPVDEAVKAYLSQANAEEIDLNLREDRVGRGDFRFTSIRFVNAQGEACSEVLSGEAVTVQVQYQLKKNLDPKKLIFTVNICDVYEQMVLSFISDEMGFVADELIDGGMLELHIPALNLRGGSYSIRLFSAYGSTGADDLQDVVDQAAKMDVHPSDFWGSGKTTRPMYSALCAGQMQHKKP
ncbi:MAG: ABC transporter ATP-binding protein [Flavobacteriales bacterium]|nr:ABC transporter ATP-binding protein [Flavobacteriales bacterium]MDG1765656.1 ABC transporter ATP-binding protein [Flavobacteriales bacterium]